MVEAVARRPKVSVVITTYNSADYLPQCLASLKEQDYPDLEFVVVDNASQDATRSILERAKQELGAKLTVILNDSNVGFAGPGMSHLFVTGALGDEQSRGALFRLELEAVSQICNMLRGIRFK